MRAAIVDCDIADGLSPIAEVDPDGERRHAALVLVRAFTEPLALLRLRIPHGGISPENLARAIELACDAAVRARIEDAGIAWSGAVPVSGLEPLRQPSYLSSRDEALRRAPAVTVAVCTRDRPEGCRRLLDSLAVQVYKPAHVIVIDNAPSSDVIRDVALAFSDRMSISYVLEPRPGLSWARNRAIDESDTEVVAWVDDDEVCDPWWLAELSRGFVEHADVDCVAGAILPAELETAAQWMFELYGGHDTQRGFKTTVFSPATRRAQSPLYPLPPFGTGGSMAFRREALERIGRFDPALGAGTLARAAEDTAAFSLLLYGGGTMVYQPTAVTFHAHRRDYEALKRLFYGYGCGLTAFYTSVVLRHPRALPHLLRLSGRALYDLTSRNGQRLGKVEEGFPRDLIRANLRGMLEGPLMYARARRRARRLRLGGAIR
jgi:glycosyltransferase involved in cell wall biosynthesis